MAVVINGTTGITTPTESVATTIGVGGATPTTSGAGITFPATQSASSNANTLDDYEEGTWTPTFDLASGSVTYSAQTGSYTKVGRVVTAIFYAEASAVSSAVSTGNAIAGLPFPAASTTYGGVAFSYSGTSGTFYNWCNLYGLTANGATVIQLRGTNNAAIAPGLNFGGATITVGTALAGTITYYSA